MGNQSTGKSTLVNHLFGCEFQVMDSSKDRGQTTKGIWMSPLCDQGLLVWDVEGSDSADRDSLNATYEQKTALFAAMMANHLLVNLWVTDVGRRVGSNYTILSKAFEVGWQLYNSPQKEAPKNIIFVVRGMNQRENEAVIRDKLTSEVKNLWREIGRSGDHRRTYYERLVHVEVFFLRDIFLDRPGFDQDIELLRTRLVDRSEAPQYKNLDVSAVSDFVVRAWNSVNTNQDLNLPNLKYMVSMVRVMAIKQELGDHFRSFIARQSGSRDARQPSSFYRELAALYQRQMEAMSIRTRNFDDAAAHTGVRELQMELEEAFDRFFAECSTQSSLDEFAEVEAWFRDNLRQDLPTFSMKEFLRNLRATIEARNRSIEEELRVLPLSPEKKAFYVGNLRRLFFSRVRENLSASQNSFFGRVSHNFTEGFSKKTEQVAARLGKQQWRLFQYEFGQAVERLKADVEFLKQENLFGEALVERINNENLKPLVLSVLRELKSKVRRFAEPLLDEYRKILRAVPAEGLSRCDFDTFHRVSEVGKPSVSAKFFPDLEWFFSDEQAIFVMGVNIVLFTKEETARLRQDFERRAREVFDAAKHGSQQGPIGSKLLTWTVVIFLLVFSGLPAMILPSLRAIALVALAVSVVSIKLSGGTLTAATLAGFWKRVLGWLASAVIGWLFTASRPHFGLAAPRASAAPSGRSSFSQSQLQFRQKLNSQWGV